MLTLRSRLAAVNKIISLSHTRQLPEAHMHFHLNLLLLFLTVITFLVVLSFLLGRLEIFQ